MLKLAITSSCCARYLYTVLWVKSTKTCHEKLLQANTKQTLTQLHHATVNYRKLLFLSTAVCQAPASKNKIDFMVEKQPLWRTSISAQPLVTSQTRRSTFAISSVEASSAARIARNFAQQQLLDARRFRVAAEHYRTTPRARTISRRQWARSVQKRGTPQSGRLTSATKSDRLHRKRSA